MLLPIKCICPRIKERSDSSTLIFIQYIYRATKRMLLNTEIAIPVDYRNQKHGCISDKLPIEVGNDELINEELKRQFRIVEDLVTHMVVTEPLQRPCKTGYFRRRTVNILCLIMCNILKMLSLVTPQ